ncbi:MAG: hypothetical protein RQ869_03025 [Candidatus Nanopusillus sp.]|nr:hypothetical protein [Candidatus Nanopusillus sp.]
MEKNHKIKKIIIRKFYEFIDGEPDKFVYLGNLVKDWNKKILLIYIHNGKNKTGVFLLYFNVKKD